MVVCPRAESRLAQLWPDSRPAQLRFDSRLAQLWPDSRPARLWNVMLYDPHLPPLQELAGLKAEIRSKNDAIKEKQVRPQYIT